MCLRPVIRGGGCLLVLIILAAGAFLLFSGEGDDVIFPDPAKSPYKLPWEAGQSRWCIQSTGGLVSHRGGGRYAYDFYMPEGTEVRAARAGKVVKVVQEHSEHGYKKPNNLVIVEHSDGTQAYYGHIQQGSAKVKMDERVKQGQVIALSGHVGHSMVPHLHFHVMDGKTRTTLPVSFSDPGKHDGIPRIFRRYTSGNRGE
ncbi:MAG: M23 family metallopeptidase [Candidatus Hydrogenedens sp.]|nr:M23 family metallopeptidase [Candidatus Hydrogenedens sp.]